MFVASTSVDILKLNPLVSSTFAPSDQRQRVDIGALAAVCLAGFAFSANYTNHAPMSGTLREAFHFDQASAGLLTTGIFLTHFLMQIPGGRLADRFGPARVMPVALVWIALGNLAVAGAGSYWHLLFWKVFTGLGTGVCFTAGARYTVSSFEGPGLHLAQGFYGGSALLGSGFVIFAVPQLLEALGWRGAFICCASVALLALVVWKLFATPPARTHTPPGLGGLLTDRQLWVLGMVQMSSFGLVIVVGSWITTLLRTNFDMPLKLAGLVGSAVLLLGILSRPTGGWLLNHLPVKSLLRGALLLSALACLSLALANSVAVISIAIVTLGIGCGLPYAALFNRAAALFPGRAGAAMGLVNMIGITMILAGAPAMGLVADLTGQFRVSFLALAAFALLTAFATAALRES